MMDKSEYEDKLAREKSWWNQTPARRDVFSKILHQPVFFTRERHAYAYTYAKSRMAEIIKKHQQGKADKLLIAPCGAGDDFKYLSQFGNEIHGMDLSEAAIKNCPPQMKVKSGDILQSGYQDNTFDLIASPLFFHHLVKIGFSPFLSEFNRILKPKGKLLILEPSILYPLNILTRPIKSIFHNPFNEVEDEQPFHPRLMFKALKSEGFTNIKMHGASFSHVIFPVVFARPFNRFTKPLLDTYPLKYLAWMVVYWAEKKS